MPGPGYSEHFAHYSSPSYGPHQCNYFEQDHCANALHNVQMAAASAHKESAKELPPFAVDETAHESAVVVELRGSKHPDWVKDAEQATSKLTRCEIKRLRLMGRKKSPVIS